MDGLSQLAHYGLLYVGYNSIKPLLKNDPYEPRVWQKFAAGTFDGDPSLVCYLARKWRKGAYTYSPFAKLQAFGCGGYSQPTPSFEWCNDDDDMEEKNEEEKKEVKIPELVEYESSSDDDEWSDEETTYEEV
ncbi:hypothetical protein BDA99DRAFT_568969 [Phascolomyces articulosus]|uniref:Uncharacterized protein n=1 Tax=Phascolomyces articulosus TaxID=60185 RepID=A0AAD5KL16_9FUNG|nr:hypothetical protein BDA99DRAFT_568969 [Phascolomyces articulosus]